MESQLCYRGWTRFHNVLLPNLGTGASIPEDSFHWNCVRCFWWIRGKHQRSFWRSFGKFRILILSLHWYVVSSVVVNTWISETKSETLTSKTKTMNNVPETRGGFHKELRLVLSWVRPSYSLLSSKTKTRPDTAKKKTRSWYVHFCSIYVLKRSIYLFPGFSSLYSILGWNWRHYS